MGHQSIGIAAMACLLLTTGAMLHPPAAAAMTAQDRADRSRRELHGKITHTRVDVLLDQTPAREAFKMLARSLDITIVGRWRTDKIGHGLDPELPISIFASNVMGEDALEMILDQATLDDATAWNMRRGYLEVGTKERLGTRASRERRIYNVRDMLLEPKYNFYQERYGLTVPPGVDLEALNEHPYRRAALYWTSDGLWKIRKMPNELAMELIRGIVETVEPGNWDYGDLPVGRENAAMNEPEEGRRGGDSAGAGGGEGQRPVPSPSRNKIASIRVFKAEHLIITAPDFVLRQVVDPPPPITPPPITEEERAERNNEATRGESYIHVIAIDDGRNRPRPETPRRGDRRDPR